jgi:hypothetical protein
MRRGLRLAHTFDPESGERHPFRSGYVNVDCEDEPA